MRSFLLAAALVAVTLAQTPLRTIWVLSAQPQPSITQFDAVNFNVLRTVNVPKQAVDHPEYLSVNRNGQLLFVLPSGIQLADGADTADQIWYSRNATMVAFPRQSSDQQRRMWFLDAAAEGLYALEIRETTTRDADGNDTTVTTATQLLRGTADGKLATVVTLPALPLCKCATGVCSETCPRWSVWAPENGIGDFFLATKFIEGQLQADYQETLLYRRAGGWRSTRLSEVAESPMDVSADGEILLAAVFDGACCGWANEGSDQLRLLRQGKSTVVFDEFQRFDNRNYDVSFFASSAKLSPNSAQIAYTIITTQRPNEEIRLSADGKDRADELARIKRTIAEVPLMEIVNATDPARVIAAIPHAELVGWLSDSELLVVQDGKLTVYTASGKRARQSSIEVRSAASVFLR
jgi:hypothetical protein